MFFGSQDPFDLEVLLSLLSDELRPKDKKSAPTRFHPGSKLNYGDLIGAARWADALCFSNKDQFPRADTTDFVELKKYKARQLASIKIAFNFRGLGRELQLHIIEELGYNDLKCLSRTSSEMEALVARRTAIIDEELCRAKVDLSTLKGFPRSLLDVPERKIGGYDEKGDFDLHPLIAQAEELHAVGTSWESVTIRMVNWLLHDEQPFLHTIKEIYENATAPPCAQFRIDLWSTQLGPAPTHGVHNKPGLVLVEGERDASGVIQPITVEQFIKGLLAAVQSLYAKMPSPGRRLRWTFDDWKTNYMDHSACAHLAGPIWRRTDDY